MQYQRCVAVEHMLYLALADRGAALEKELYVHDFL